MTGRAGPLTAAEPLTALVTGASRGMGAGLAHRLAAAGYTLLLTARDSRRARRTVASVRAVAAQGQRVEWLPADLSEGAQIDRLAEAVRAAVGVPDLVVHGAALIPLAEERSGAGFEMQWAVNHLAPFRLTGGLGMGEGRGRAPRRIVTVASKLHREGRIERVPDLFTVGTYDRVQRYRDTKLANVLFARAAARRLDPGVCLSISLHPGAAGTLLFQDLEGTATVDRLVDRTLRGLRNKPPWGLAECVDRLVDACTRPLEAADHGGYLEDGQWSTPAPSALDDDLGEWLWAASERATGAR